ncbi:MAG: prephenate dehydrogenase/arogenate dehydrogenase family protein [Pseudomonadota bacterium]
MFEKVVILGVGLLGGSLARDLKQRQLARTIIGVCRSDSTADYAISNHVVDQVLPLDQAIQGADLLVLATPMQVMLPLMEEIAQEIPKDLIVTDVGSVKTDLYAQLTTKLPGLLNQFVLAHPIAGGENSGVQAARSGLFENKHVIITKTEEADSQHLQRVAGMWQALGANVLAMSLQQHDAIFAKTSHLPHVVAFSLVNYLSNQENREELFNLAAAGFYDFTRIASSDAEMWRDICITNREQVLNALDGYQAQLTEIRERINQADQQGILEYFGTAKASRDAGLLKKANTNPKNH